MSSRSPAARLGAARERCDDGDGAPGRPTGAGTPRRPDPPPEEDLTGHDPHPDPAAGATLYWIPLGAGGHCVRFSGRVYEAAHAATARRQRRDLFHAALVVCVDGADTTVEVAPVWQHGPQEVDRGVTISGPVGLRQLGRSSWFRYELRCWRGGTIPDLAEAVGGPTRLDADDGRCRALLAAAHDVPAVTWGRDELGLGEMWNSNSVIAWLLVRAGVDTGELHPPDGGRAPGWGAGLRAAGLRSSWGTTSASASARRE